MNLNLLSKSSRWTIAPILAAIAITGGGAFYAIQQFGPTSKPSELAPTLPIPKQVVTLGRLEPVGEVIRVSVPAVMSNDRISQLLVQRGDRVEADRAIAVMDSRDRLEDEVQQAKEQVNIARAKLAQVKAGAKPGEIAARRATVSRLQAELAGQISAQRAEIARLTAQLEGESTAQQAAIDRLRAELQGQKQALKATVDRVGAETRNARSDLQRYESLYREGAVSSQEVDRKRLSAETSAQQFLESQANRSRAIATLAEQINEAKANRDKTIATLAEQINEAKANRDKTIATLAEQINEAKATLSQTAEVRFTDVQAAAAEVSNARASLKRAETSLTKAYIRTPAAGRILEIYAKPGEVVGSKGIADLGQTDRMQVVAEVYQTDISKIRTGQKVIITSQSFSGEISGIVRQIGLQVTQQEISSNTPGENLDRRVVEVRINLNAEGSKRVADLTNLQVQVAIDF
ncbi:MULTISPECIES: HlyD family efflux transporter periplasmic adaptor subunit [unclassified Microcoleus]|uniref:HlyD family efflux transporter periplasmic adaptor subunit n=1 Tax=unclassified Microcoleus TaxID=2642155 RepID=UPI001DFDC10F|nr:MULTISPECIES: HlyD family efflux transporter periplasmic adaptor subunit [unclassified Microcoleus]TAE10022.1 MAG: HlyD family efflux transporter periplasmic adaptor subunit [Oscillatoriales cyanobacterium]MCC3413304.1 HlyD family efflux transporter periplasmic adaptor subunit [Microcoleus sp. PH2017_02_FOX_O_A]MCC3491865.1 HlyD family efflux transporter periplasmic adaptor subunit [Microcoleus sp. PH2017_16_JOR_D_A]MCC3498254.1 HlyD family efflux transporter periplasmic adaptor subunit [Mic